jgi:adenine-specific DNA-methyltransferase
LLKRGKLELTWVGKDERVKLEPRILVKDPSKSYGDPKAENMLIYGDNLLALKALEQDFTGKIKCIFIDPPFNTGQAFDNYDDNLEHSLWLEMMHFRLVLLNKLLCEPGLIWIHLDDTELHYCKLLMDEIFGRNNFVTQITYERSGSAGLGQGGLFVNTSEYILLYKKGVLSASEIRSYQLLDLDTMKRYKTILIDKGQRDLVHEFPSKSNGLPVKLFKHHDYELGTISLKNFDKREEEIRTTYKQYFDSIFRTTNPQKENEFQNMLISNMEKDCLYSVDYIPSRGKYTNQETTLYYFNKEIFAWLKDSALLQGENIVKANKLTTIWTHGDIPKADLANEGGVDGFWTLLLAPGRPAL